MQVFKTEAIMLRRTNYGEADRIISFITPDRGKLSAIAKGVRKPKSKLAGGLELFAVSDITIAEGRGDLGLITSARMQQFYGDILHDYDRMNSGYEFIKKINKATETVSEPDFYYLLCDGLKYLNVVAIDWRLVELWFGLHFIHLLGHGLNISTDGQGKKLDAEKTYTFDFTDMAFMEHSNGTYKSDHIKLLRLLAAKTPDIVRQVKGVEALLDDCLQLVRNLD